MYFPFKQELVYCADIVRRKLLSKCVNVILLLVFVIHSWICTSLNI